MLDDKAQLAGLSDDQIANAAQEAKIRHLDGKFVIPLQNTTQQPLLLSLADRAVREKLFEARWTATEKSDRNDTRAAIAQIAQLRARKAQLLGYPDFASYQLYDQMAQDPQTVDKFLVQLVPATTKKDRRRIQTGAGRHRQGWAAFRSQAVGLGALCRAGAQGEI